MRRRFYLLVCALYLLFAFNGAARGQAPSTPPPQNAAITQNTGMSIPDGYVVPFQFDINTLPIPVVHVRINGHEPMAFAIDTGSSAPLLVLPRYARELDIHSAGVSAQFAIGKDTEKKNFVQGMSLTPVQVQMVGRSGSAPISLMASLTLIEDVPFDMGDKEPLAGLIGWPLFKSQAVCFDFAARTLTFHTKSLPAHLPTGTTSLPLQMDSLEVGSLLRVPVEIGKGKPISCIVDTGYMDTLLPDTRYNDLKPLAAEEGQAEFLDRAFATTALLTSSLHLGAFEEPEVVVNTAPQDKLIGPGLGLDLLSRFRVWLDFPNRRMLLQRAANYRERLLPQGNEEFYCKQEQGHWQVDWVWPSSPAAEAGLKSGDRLVSVDGVPVTDRTGLEVHALACGKAGTTATLTVLREDKPIAPLSYRRRQRFTFGKTYIGTGFSWRPNPQTKYLTVYRLYKDSPAILSGLRIGDNIQEINGLDVRSVPVEQLRAQVRQTEGTEVTLLVQRAGEDKPRQILVRLGKVP